MGKTPHLRSSGRAQAPCIQSRPDDCKRLPRHARLKHSRAQHSVLARPPSEKGGSQQDLDLFAKFAKDSIKPALDIIHPRPQQVRSPIYYTPSQQVTTWTHRLKDTAMPRASQQPARPAHALGTQRPAATRRPLAGHRHRCTRQRPPNKPTNQHIVRSQQYRNKRGGYKSARRHIKQRKAPSHSAVTSPAQNHKTTTVQATC